jgi:hypothetical protein
MLECGNSPLWINLSCAKLRLGCGHVNGFRYRLFCLCHLTINFDEIPPLPRPLLGVLDSAAVQSISSSVDFVLLPDAVF